MSDTCPKCEKLANKAFAAHTTIQCLRNQLTDKDREIERIQAENELLAAQVRHLKTDNRELRRIAYDEEGGER
jgi:hypothetical protein